MIRNAFDNLGTESALRRIANLLTFARDQNDRILVSVTGSPQIYNRNSSTTVTGNDSQVHFSGASWNIMDSREAQRVALRTASDAVRRGRWTF